MFVSVIKTVYLLVGMSVIHAYNICH